MSTTGKSPYDGDLVYWSIRLGAHPEMPNIKAKLLKQQKGKCAWCELHFHDGNVIEQDHIIPRALGGKDEWKNRQLLHRHCHDEKTAIDLKEIRKKRHSESSNQLALFWEQIQWEWENDIPNFTGNKSKKSVLTKGKHIE